MFLTSYPLLLLFLPTFCAILSDDFNDWLVKNFGVDVQTMLNRADLDTLGSFGGKIDPSQLVHKDPVVFVHGVSDRAGDKPKYSADFFNSAHGYEWSELYGTTYANASQENPLQWAQYALQCKYVKQVRMLIIAVHYYTARPVNLVAYSMGVPLSRKAILGGRCVETDEDLGEPLTPFIETFVGVSGPNHGARPEVINPLFFHSVLQEMLFNLPSSLTLTLLISYGAVNKFLSGEDCKRN
uniref:Lipase domain-containing protein n=1 Tax=Ascaris lumbricoides TaxID=6252 RepID=A0A9J2P3H6_ASCLU